MPGQPREAVLRAMLGHLAERNVGHHRQPYSGMHRQTSKRGGGRPTRDHRFTWTRKARND
eukprot:15469641-Alexandrium_andersonii.AAC.1